MKRLAMLVTLLTACGQPKQVAFEDCEVAKPTYGNDLASCLVVLGHWPAADARTAAEWAAAEQAFLGSDDPRRGAAYRVAARRDLKGIGFDSLWVERRLSSDSAVVAVLDSVNREVRVASTVEARRRMRQALGAESAKLARRVCVELAPKDSAVSAESIDKCVRDWLREEAAERQKVAP